MKSKIRLTIIYFAVVTLLMGCASMANLQEAWNKLSPNNKARIVVGGFQDQLNTLFDLGKAYVTAHPDKLPMWKGQIIPAFDTANKMLRGYILLLGSIDGGMVTPEQLYKEIPPIILSITKLLTSMGVKIS